MRQTPQTDRAGPHGVAVAASALALAALAGLAAALWAENGAAVFLQAVQAGLATCF